MLSKTSVWRYFDVWLLAAVLLLTGYGILMIRSAITGAPAFESYPQQQLIWATLGLVILLATAAIDYRILTSSHWWIYAGLVAEKYHNRVGSRIERPDARAVRRCAPGAEDGVFNHLRISEDDLLAYLISSAAQNDDHFV